MLGECLFLSFLVRFDLHCTICAMRFRGLRLTVGVPRRHIWEAIKHVWPEAHWPGEQPLSGIESRL